MANVSHSTPLIALDGVAIDCETTHLDAATARLVQIGAIAIQTGRADPGVRFERLVNPKLPIPKEATAIHHISDADVTGAPDFAQIAQELEGFLGKAILVGHNIGYDIAVLKREYERAGRPWPQPRALDVRMLAKLAAPTLAHYGLKQLCEWLGLKDEPAGSAVDDAIKTARVFEALVPLLRKKDIRTIAEAETASRRLTETEVGETMGLPVVSSDKAPLARIDSFPYRHRVRELMSSPPIFASSGMTIAEGLELLLAHKVSSVFVSDARGSNGIVTERDVLRALQSENARGFGMPLDSIAKRPLHTIHEEAFVYRAIGRMDRLGIRHLAVRDSRGQIVGALTPRNLLHQRASAAIMLGDEIDKAPAPAALGQAWAGLIPMARALTNEGVDARNIAQVISSEICALTRRAAQLAEQDMAKDGWGAPPVRYAVMVLGSAGRGESLLAADQDNAIVYERGQDGGAEDKWFQELATRMTETLDTVGVPFCKGGVMAKNQLWRHSVDTWRELIEGWVRRHKPEDVLHIDTFFDGLAVHGETGLCDIIWTHAYEVGHRTPDFLALLAESCRKWRAPFGVFGGIRTDSDGRADLKKGGLTPIFTAARLLSIRHNLRGRSTPDRLSALAERGIGSAADIVELLEAHRTILRVMLAQQIMDAEVGTSLSTRVAIDRLPPDDLRKLKSALGKVSIATELVMEGKI